MFDNASKNNHHFSKKVVDDSGLLMNRFYFFYLKGALLPSDENNMKHFNWSKDHLNRCFQFLKEMGVLTYSRNNRRTTLQFLGEYQRYNDRLPIKKKAS